MGADDGAVQKEVFEVWGIGAGILHLPLDILVAPAEEAFVDGVPFAVPFWKRPPSGSCTGNPEDAFDEATAVGLLSDIHVLTGTQKLEDTCPLVEAERYGSHAASLKQNLEQV